MKLISYLLLCAAVIGACYGIDKLFHKLFRSKKEHKSGLAVRLNNRYALGGLVLLVLAAAALTRWEMGPLLPVCAAILGLTGLVLLIYYMSFGLFYDADGFVLTTFGRKSVSYRHSDIVSQQIFTTAGGIVIELYLSDGRAATLQSSMEGVFPFLDAAFSGWCRQKGLEQAECPFHDPANSCWFPPAAPREDN